MESRMRQSYVIAGKEVHIFPHALIDARMYVLLHGREALVIDPHPMPEALAFLWDADAESCRILLTHEHYDHISGVNRLRELFRCRVLCSEACAERMGDPRRSAAAYFLAQFIQNAEMLEQARALVDPHYSCTAEETFIGSTCFSWGGLQVQIDETPGHSPGGQVIRIGEEAAFTGDSLIPGVKTITRFPGGSRKAFQEKTVPCLLALPDSCIIFPGHGEPAVFGSEVCRYGLQV